MSSEDRIRESGVNQTRMSAPPIAENLNDSRRSNRSGSNKSSSLSLSKKDEEELELLSKMDKSHLNYSTMTHNVGLLWCIVFGLSRGGLYAATKVSEDLTAIGTT